MRLSIVKIPAMARRSAALMALAAFTGANQAAAGQGWGVGDHVTVYVSGSCCYDGTVAATGSGSMAGYYLIHFDNPASHDQYAKAANVVARGRTPGTAGGQAPAANRNRKIHCVMGTIGGKPVCLPTAAPG